jgi:hypothetical protein
LKAAKRVFLDRYNYDPTNDEGAAKDALNSASQHNSLYATTVSEKERGRVREGWKSHLRDLARRYESPVWASQEEAYNTYEADIEELKRRMSKDFADFFRRDRHPRYGYEPGFRISHAQKSLAVFLKHMWCMGKIGIPPECPVDRRILERAGWRCDKSPWTYVNSVEEHRRMIACLAECAKTSRLELAVWELIEFQK